MTPLCSPFCSASCCVDNRKSNGKHSKQAQEQGRQRSKGCVGHSGPERAFSRGSQWGTAGELRRAVNFDQQGRGRYIICSSSKREQGGVCNRVGSMTAPAPNGKQQGWPRNKPHWAAWWPGHQGATSAGVLGSPAAAPTAAAWRRCSNASMASARPPPATGVGPPGGTDSRTAAAAATAGWPIALDGGLGGAARAAAGVGAAARARAAEAGRAGAAAAGAAACTQWQNQGSGQQWGR